MKVLILGANGMIGRKFTGLLVAEGSTGRPITQLVLHDIAMPEKPTAEFPIAVEAGDISSMTEAERLASHEADLIVNLAAIVSGEAEANFTKGWEINARGGWHFLEALRQRHEVSMGKYVPKLVFASSIAVFGPPYPEQIPDD